jgi:acyl-CoA hydrolase
MRPADTTRTASLALASDEPLRRRFLVVDEPLPGNFRYGLLLEALDRLAEETALDYARRTEPRARVVTAAVDNILVRGTPEASRDVRLEARINHVGRSSMEVGLRVTQAGDVHVASCYFTMVARLEDGGGARSVPLPPLEYADADERRRERQAVARREAWRRQLEAAQEPPSREEYELLARLHEEGEAPGRAGLRAGEAILESWERAYPEQENVPRTIFGGYVMRRAYELASVCAASATPDRPVLAAVNRVNFLQPVRIGDVLRYTSRVVHTTGCHLVVETAIERRARDRSAQALSSSCLFTFRHVDAEMRLRPLPPVYPATYVEDARLLAARRHHAELVRHWSRAVP